MFGDKRFRLIRRHHAELIETLEINFHIDDRSLRCRRSLPVARLQAPLGWRSLRLHPGPLDSAPGISGLGRLLFVGRWQLRTSLFEFVQSLYSFLDKTHG